MRFGVHATGPEGSHTRRDFGRAAAKALGLAAGLALVHVLVRPLCGDAVSWWYPACNGGTWWVIGHWLAGVLAASATLALAASGAFALSAALDDHRLLHVLHLVGDADPPPARSIPTW